jgi:hypothetical protein
MKKRKCKLCKEPFVPTRADQLYHSSKCRKAAYEKSEAAKQRKRKYAQTISGTLAQFKYDQSASGQLRRIEYRDKLRSKQLDRQQAAWSSSSKERKKVAREIAAEEKRRQEIAEKRKASADAKHQAIRTEILHGANETALHPEEFVAAKMKIAFPDGLPRRVHWKPVSWETYATQEEREDVRIRFHFKKVETLTNEKQLPFDQVLMEYKKDLIERKIKAVTTRYGFMETAARASGKNGLPKGTLDSLMNELSTEFDYKWAGGKPWGSGEWGLDKYDEVIAKEVTEI